MVLQPGNGMPVGHGSYPGPPNMTTQLPGVGTPQMQTMRGHLGNQLTEQGTHLIQAQPFPQRRGSQQMALAASAQEQMRSATPRRDEAANQVRYAQFQQVGIKVKMLQSCQFYSYLLRKNINMFIQGNAHAMEVDSNLKRIVLLGQTGGCCPAFHNFMSLLVSNDQSRKHTLNSHFHRSWQIQHWEHTPRQAVLWREQGHGLLHR